MPFSVEEEEKEASRALSKPQKEAEEELWEPTEQEIPVPKMPLFLVNLG